MTLTYDEKREKILHRLDIEIIIEALQITADELLDRFDDKLLVALLEGKFDELD
jgi:hypothetical protein